MRLNRTQIIIKQEEMPCQQIAKAPDNLIVGANQVSLARCSKALTEREVSRLKQQGVRISLGIDHRRLHKLFATNHNLALTQLGNDLL